MASSSSSSSSSTSEKLCRRFSLAEIQSATGGFSDKHVIGEGGFGKVYKGRIDNGSVTVAIKRLSKKQGKADDAKQGQKEFAAEMETLTKVRHHNLVSLIGYCDDEEEQTKQKEMILVYEYMANGTLADHLYKLSGSSDASSSLSWNQRLKICIGAGRGLDYLHSGCSIVHRDVKPTNILLDEHWTAKVADFGLAKQLSKGMLQSHVSTMIKGTFGYFDPSYFTTGRLTRASDTYAFGVILLEVLSEKPALGRNVVEDQLPMSIWAQEKIRSGKANQIVASNLKDQISEGCLKTFVGVAKKCLHQKPEKRVTMTRAVAQLELALEQQERKRVAATHRLQFWPFWTWSRDIASGKGSTPNIEDVPAFPLAELKDITYGFSSKCLIANGREGGSDVFHGVLKTGQHAAIKKLHKKLPYQTFLAQVSTIYRLKHENVVELLGYCVDGGLQILVYEYAPRGSLDDILHATKVNLSWAKRIEVAVGAAKGLKYIHDKELIHRNINPRNILLFDGGITKITDLHISTECACEEAYRRESAAHVFSPCHRYHPPEFEWDGHSHNCDVYSFGKVLLELFIRIPRMGVHSLHAKALKKAASITSDCLQRIAFRRPCMLTVLNDLEIASQLAQVYLQQQQTVSEC